MNQLLKDILTITIPLISLFINLFFLFKINRKAERLKADLNYSTQQRLSLGSAEREAFVSYNKAFASWFYALHRVDYYSYEPDKIKALETVKLDLKKKLVDYDLAEAHLLLLHQSVDFLQKRDELIRRANEYSYKVENAIDDIIYHFSVNGYKTLKFNEGGSKESLDNFVTEYGEINDKYITTLSNLFQDARLVYLDILVYIRIRVNDITQNLKTE